MISFLSIAISAQYSIKANFWSVYRPDEHAVSFVELVIQTVPIEIKSFIIGILRFTADEYMHLGPSKRNRQDFSAGSFAGNTDIMTLLPLIILFNPLHIDSYTVISHNLAIHLSRFSEAIRLIQRGILANKNSIELHKLYAAGAYCYGFSKNNMSQTIEQYHRRKIAVRYLDAAIKAYKDNEDKITDDMFDNFANIENYYIMKSHFLADTKNQKESVHIHSSDCVNEHQADHKTDHKVNKALETRHSNGYDRETKIIIHTLVMLFVSVFIIKKQTT